MINDEWNDFEIQYLSYCDLIRWYDLTMIWYDSIRYIMNDMIWFWFENDYHLAGPVTKHSEFQFYSMSLQFPSCPVCLRFTSSRFFAHVQGDSNSTKGNRWSTHPISVTFSSLCPFGFLYLNVHEKRPRAQIKGLEKVLRYRKGLEKSKGAMPCKALMTWMQEMAA